MIIWGQAEGDVFGEFFGQIPAILIIFVCGTGVLLLFAIIWFAYLKPVLRNRRNSADTPTSSGLESSAQPVMPNNPPRSDHEDEDMPDLGMLLDTSSLDKELPDVGPVNVSAKPKPAAIPPAHANRGEVRVKLNTGNVARANELLTILRDPRDGRLMIQLDNVAYRTLTESPQVKDRFVKLMRELNDVVTKPDDNPPADEDLPDYRPSSAATTPPPPINADGAMPGDLPSYRMEDHMTATRGGTYATGSVPEVNIAEAIESYLQHKLRHTGDFAGRSIHVHATPGGGVRIQVDNRFFEAVDEVDEPEIRDYLLATIQEWQSRQ